MELNKDFELVNADKKLSISNDLPMEEVKNNGDLLRDEWTVDPLVAQFFESDDFRNKALEIIERNGWNYYQCEEFFNDGGRIENGDETIWLNREDGREFVEQENGGVVFSDKMIRELPAQREWIVFQLAKERRQSRGVAVVEMSFGRPWGRMRDLLLLVGKK